MAAFITKLTAGSIIKSAFGACDFKFVPALIAKLGAFSIIKLAF
jgi:hypothetical protein